MLEITNCDIQFCENGIEKVAKKITGAVLLCNFYPHIAVLFKKGATASHKLIAEIHPTPSDESDGLVAAESCLLSIVPSVDISSFHYLSLGTYNCGTCFRKS